MALAGTLWFLSVCATKLANLGSAIVPMPTLTEKLAGSFSQTAAVLTEPDDQLFEHDAIEIGIGARVVHVLQHAIGRHAEFIVRVRIAHQHFEAARAAAALELHQLLHVQLENLAVELELAGAGGQLRRLVDELRLDVHVAVGFGQRFDFGGHFFAADRRRRTSARARLRRGFLVLDQFGNRIRLRASTRASAGDRSAPRAGRDASVPADAWRAAPLSSDFGSMSEISNAIESEVAQLLGTLLPGRFRRRRWPGRAGGAAGRAAGCAALGGGTGGLAGAAGRAGRRGARACGAAGRCARARRRRGGRGRARQERRDVRAAAARGRGGSRRRALGGGRTSYSAGGGRRRRRRRRHGSRRVRSACAGTRAGA